MKLKATKRDFKGERVLKVGYCKVQFLFPERDAFAYSSGVYGWACDYFKADGFYVSTGYNPIGTLLPDTHKVCEKYDALASEVFKELNYNQRINQLTQLRLAFSKEIKSLLGW